MYLYFDNTGKLLKSLTHGTPARTGSRKFEIFAHFHTKETIANASLKLVYPDGTQTEIPMEMAPVSPKFEKTEYETSESIEPFKNNETYPGFLLDFSEKTVTLLKTPGFYKAYITAYNAGGVEMVQGVATFVCQDGPEPETDEEYGYEDALIDLLRLLATKANIKGNEVVIYFGLEHPLSSFTSLDKNKYSVGDIVYDETTKSLYKITDVENNEHVMVSKSIIVAETPTDFGNLVDYPEGQVFLVLDSGDYYYGIHNHTVLAVKKFGRPRIAFDFTEAKNVEQIYQKKIIYSQNEPENPLDNDVWVNELGVKESGNDINLENGTGLKSVQGKIQDGKSTFNTNVDGLVHTSVASGEYAVLFGGVGEASGKRSTVLGGYNVASGSNSLATGEATKATGRAASSFGEKTQALADEAFAIGITTIASGVSSHAEGSNTTASGAMSHAEGMSTKALGLYAHAEGSVTEAKGNESHAEGQATKAEGQTSHTEGYKTFTGAYVEPEPGEQQPELPSTPSLPTESGADEGFAAHAEGVQTKAYGNGSHAEGYGSIAKHGFSHAEGHGTLTTEFAAHAEGEKTTANGVGSHAEGFNTTASIAYQHVSGKYNKGRNNTLFEIGNGTADERKNAFEVYTDGHAEIQSGVKIVNGNLQIGNTVLTEAMLRRLLDLLN